MGCRGNWETCVPHTLKVRSFVFIFSMKSGKCNMGIELDKHVLCHLLFFNINKQDVKVQPRSGEFQIWWYSGGIFICRWCCLLVLLDFDLWCTRKHFATQRDAIKIDISTFKAGNMLLSHKWWISRDFSDPWLHCTLSNSFISFN